MTQNEVLSPVTRPNDASQQQTASTVTSLDEKRELASTQEAPTIPNGSAVGKEEGLTFVKRVSFKGCDDKERTEHHASEKSTNPLLMACETPPQRGLSRSHCYVPPFDLGSTISSCAEHDDCATDVRSNPSHPSRPFVIGVCGGTASGKTTVCELFEKHLKDERVAFIPSDNFYKCLTPEQKQKAADGEYDFDHPNSIDWEGVKKCVDDLRNFKPTSLPTYDFCTHSRTSERVEVPLADVIIVEGILIFSSDQELRDMIDLKIFVDCDADVRLARRLSRDIAERGRELSSVLVQYMKFVKPSYETFVDPSKRHADIIVPNFGNQMNMKGVELLIQQIRHQLDVRRHLCLYARKKDESECEEEGREKELL